MMVAPHRNSVSRRSCSATCRACGADSVTRLFMNSQSLSLRVSVAS